MKDKRILHELLKEHEGELLTYDDENCFLKVTYSRGALPMFSKFEIFTLDRSKFSVIEGKVQVSQKELEESSELYQFRNFFSLLELSLTMEDEISQDTLEEMVENIKNGIYPFIRIKDGKVEMLVVSTGNVVKRKGVFYYPELQSTQEIETILQEPEAITLIELGESVRIYKENFEKIPQL